MCEANHFITADEFLDSRFDLPESGQWSELEAGVAVHRQPPDLDHGNTILNLSKALADYVSTGRGYACFDLGLRMRHDPDTIRYPAVCYFLTGDRFAETDQLATASVPELVIELASTPDRRRKIDERVSGYLEWGVTSVWVIDPAEQSLRSVHTDYPDRSRCFTGDDWFDDREILEGLRLEIAMLFAEPVWWS